MNLPARPWEPLAAGISGALAPTNFETPPGLNNRLLQVYPRGSEACQPPHLESEMSFLLPWNC
jgi:hypothetical protein